MSAAQSQEAEFQLRQKLLQDQKFLLEGVDFKVVSAKPENGGYRFSFETSQLGYQNLFLPLIGKYQLSNAVLAVAACEAFLGGGTQPIPEPILHSALADATSPARMQVFQKEPLTILDAAHNPAGSRALVESLDEYFEIDSCVLVLATMEDKDYPKMLEILAPKVTKLIVTSAQTERAADPQQILQLAEKLGLDSQVVEGSELALEYATDIALEQQLPVVVTGSVLLLGEILEKQRLEAEIEED